MADFPSYALLLFDGLKRKRDAGVTATEMESGPPKLLKKESRVMIRRPAAILLKSATDYANFIDWYENDINRGDWFNWTDPADGQAKSARFQGGEIAEEVPQIKDHSRWKLSCTIETWGI